MSDSGENDVIKDDNPENEELVRDSSELNRNTVGTFGFTKSSNKGKTTSNPHN